MNSAETHLFRTRWGEIDTGEAENSVRTACHENRDFRKILEIRTRRGEIDPADSEFQGLVTRFVQKRDFQTCNFLDGWLDVKLTPNKRHSAKWMMGNRARHHPLLVLLGFSRAPPGLDEPPLHVRSLRQDMG